ncbi:MAG: NADH-quinone oxidoreductase subunit NuoG [Nevskia sp.]|nr:NADH-quinone oxidoreductase subunit NuoG [Nevskia sp.]
MAIIHVDGKQYEVDGGDNLLHACLSLGLDIPYFCWHPALGSVGACRQCAVKAYRDANDKQGRLVMSCMTQATDGSYISISDAEASDFRESVIEWLMTNHPHDCPVCAEGGHCHLQDMTVMTGHAARRYRFSKRTHRNQYLGPFIQHEMNRCIACYRCVRYYKDYAGGGDLGVFGTAANVYFGREADGVLESEFAGNLTEVCPTGVFTDKTHGEHYSRKWDMQFAPSICQGCALGCNTSPGERYGQVRRIENRYNGSVNHYFLCDRGRFGYGFVNRKDRPRRPLLKRDGAATAVDTAEAVERGGELLAGARRVIGIGSPRASLEANFALRELVGAEHFFDGHAAAEGALVAQVARILRAAHLRIPSLRVIEQADAAFVLGEDVGNTAPRIALALRQTARSRQIRLAAAKHIAHWQAAALADIAQHDKSPVFIAGTDATRIDDIAAGTFHAAPADLARLGFAVAHRIDAAAPAVAGLAAETEALAARIAEALLAADKPLVVSGTGAGDAAVIDAAAAVAQALQSRGKHAELSLVVPEVNSMGLALMLADRPGQGLDAALDALASGAADAVVVLENDLYRRAPAARVDAALANARLIAVDHQFTATAEKADLLLSAGSFAEGDGTVVSNEGRAQRYFQVYDPVYYDPETRIREAWYWLRDLRAELRGTAAGWQHFDDVTAACAQALPALAGIVRAAPDAQFRVRGLKVARESHRYSGRTAMRANLSVHEPRASQDPDTALAYSMEGHHGSEAGDRPAALIPYAWAPGWNSPQSWNKFQDEVGGHLRGGDAGVRLFEPAAAAPAQGYAGAVPAAFAPRADAFSAVPLYHVFGSDELSALAAPVAERAPKPYLALNPADAAALGAAADGLLEAAVDGAGARLPLKLAPALPRGTVGLPAGLHGVPFAAPGTWIRLQTVKTA